MQYRLKTVYQSMKKIEIAKRLTCFSNVVLWCASARPAFRAAGMTCQCMLRQRSVLWLRVCSSAGERLDPRSSESEVQILPYPSCSGYSSAEERRSLAAKAGGSNPPIPIHLFSCPRRVLPV